MFNYPSGIALTAAGDTALIVSWRLHICPLVVTNVAPFLQADSQSSTIRKLVIVTAAVTTLAGTAGVTGFANGVSLLTTFNIPVDVAIDALGVVAFVADSSNHILRRINISTGAVATISGQGGVSGTSDGLGTAAKFGLPYGISLDAVGSTALIVSEA